MNKKRLYPYHTLFHVSIYEAVYKELGVCRDKRLPIFFNYVDLFTLGVFTEKKG